jgi:aspartyl-tRNA(Asn)/glutamyl-tRNA(Gln) amidotransferase subunit A
MADFGDIVERNRALNALVAFVESAQKPHEALKQAQSEQADLTLRESQNSSNGEHLQAKMPENALQNWTFAIKSNIAVEGAAHTAGIGGYRHRIAAKDAFCVDKLRQAGADIIGIANMEEAALGAVTNNPHFGKTINPLRENFTAGGSSGGSAAAVAAGMTRVSLGTDTMGSCRIPAAYCGVVGFKPSVGRISTGGVEPLSRRLDHVGILAKTVEDVAAVFAVLDCFDASNADARRYPPTSPRAFTRYAVLDSASRAGLEANVRRAHERALASLASRGATLIEKSLDQTALARMRRAGLLVCEAELANTLGTLIAANDGGVSTQLANLIAFGAKQSAPKLAAAHAALDDAVLILRAQLDGVDAIVWPTAPQTAFSFDAPVPANQADFTCLANFTGAPAISIPIATDDLPAGLQLIAALGEDMNLLHAARAIAPAVAS